MGRVQIAPVVGKASGETWSQVVARPIKSGSGDISVSKTQAVWLVSITVKDVNGEAADVVGDRLVEQLSQAITPEESLSYLRAEEGLVSAAMGVLRGSHLHLYGFGGGRAVLWREKQLGLVLKAPDDGWVAREGTWHEGDRWLLGTTGLVGEMSRQLVEEVLEAETAEQAGEDLVMRVLLAEENSGVAGWMMYGMADVEAEGLIETREDVVEPDTEIVEDKEPVRREEEAKAAQVPVDKGEARKPTVYLRADRTRRKRILLMGLVVLVLLVVSVVVGQKKRQEQMWKTKYETVTQRAEGLLQQAQMQAGSNRVTAAETAQSAQKLLETAMSEFADQPDYQQKLQAEVDKAKQVYATVAGQEQLTEVPVWFDLSIAKEDFFGDLLAVSDNNVVVLDKTHGLLMEVDAESKETQLVGGGNLLGGAKLLAASGGRGIVLSTSGLIDLTLTKKTAGVLVEPDSTWQQPVALGLFAGNVYMLDAGAGTIWQYPGLSSGVGSRRTWVTDQQVSLTNAVDMAIDGDIWVLSKNGEVQRLRRGEAVDFTISGLEQGMQEPVAIDTNADLDSLYILDRGNNRVVVVSKEGQYEKQLVWQGFSGVTDIAVVGDPPVVMAVSGASLYRISLQ